MDTVEADILVLFARAFRQAQNLIAFVNLVMRVNDVVREDGPRSWAMVWSGWCEREKEEEKEGH